MLAGADRASKLGKTHIHTPANLVPIGTGAAKFQGLWRLVGVRARDANGFDVGIGEGKYGVTRGDFAHEVVERVVRIVFLTLWRPQVTARYFMSVGLLLVYTPI